MHAHCLAPASCVALAHDVRLQHVSSWCCVHCCLFMSHVQHSGMLREGHLTDLVSWCAVLNRVCVCFHCCAGGILVAKDVITLG